MSKRTIIAGVLIAAMLGTSGCGLIQKEEETLAYELRPTVAAETPKTGDIVLYTDITGTIAPQQSASVMPKIGGEVLEVHFQAGDQVEAGQLLITIDSDALTALSLQVDAARVQYEEAARTLERMKPLYESGDISAQSYEQTQDGAESARIAYESAKNQYELQTQYTQVTAPISGTVESRNVEVHDHIGSSTVICEISGGSGMELSFGLTEKMHRSVQPGDQIEATKNGMTYEAEVTETGSMINSSTGLYDAKARLLDAEGLTTGMRVELTLVMDRALSAMTVPLSAVNYDNGQAFVYCYDNGIAKRTDITAGIYDTEKMQVIDGLDGENMVITSWSNELSDGAEVLLSEGSESDD